MLITKKIMTEQAEEDCVNAILEQVRKNNMTIENLKEVTDKVVNYLESNAVLEMEDSYVEIKSNFKMEEELLQGLPEVSVKIGEEIAPDEIKKNMQ